MNFVVILLRVMEIGYELVLPSYEQSLLKHLKALFTAVREV